MSPSAGTVAGVTHDLRGALTLETCLTSILESSRATAALADGHLDAAVASCPGWSVRDAITHLIDVHWSWTRVAEHLLTEPVRGSAEPSDDDHLLARYLAGAERLVEVLGSADQSAAVWTWAPTQRDVAFITRHQVQEALVHGWDVADAVGAAWPVGAAIADDCVEEFLTFSVASDAYPKEGAAPLGAPVTLRSTDTGRAWTVGDDAPGTIAARPGASEGAVPLAAPSADLLLWLYRRVDLPAPPGDAAVLARLRDLTYSD